MSKEIEEMAEVYESARLKARETLGSMNEGEGMWYSKALYNAGYRKQEWIAVEERLPEDYEWCLLFLDNGKIVIGWYHSIAKVFVDGGIVVINEVTHWMPLPEPPKGGER